MPHTTTNADYTAPNEAHSQQRPRAQQREFVMTETDKITNESHIATLLRTFADLHARREGCGVLIPAVKMPSGAAVPALAIHIVDGGLVVETFDDDGTRSEAPEQDRTWVLDRIRSDDPELADLIEAAATAAVADEDTATAEESAPLQQFANAESNDGPEPEPDAAAEFVRDEDPADTAAAASLTDEQRDLLACLPDSVVATPGLALEPDTLRAMVLLHCESAAKWETLRAKLKANGVRVSVLDPAFKATMEQVVAPRRRRTEEDAEQLRARVSGTAGARPVGDPDAAPDYTEQWPPLAGVPPRPTPGLQDVDDIVAQFNARYAVTKIGAKVAVVGLDNNGKLEFQTKGSFIESFENVKVKVGIKYIQAPLFWCQNKGRRQYLNGIGLFPRVETDAETLNLWRGFGFKLQGFDGYALPTDMTTMPRPVGSYERLKQHVRDTLCEGSEAFATYFWKAWAYAFQNPGTPWGMFMVMWGEEGTGKGTVHKIWLRLWGSHGVHVMSPEQLTGQFNSHLRYAIGVACDEAAFVGDLKAANKLKALITEDTLNIEQKYFDMIYQANQLHLIVATNEKHAVLAGRDSRRPFVMQANKDHANDHAYFGLIREEMLAGGYEALLWDLLTMDLAGFNVRDIPVTAALVGQRALSAASHEKWWEAVLHRGFVLQSERGNESFFHHWNLAGHTGSRDDHEGEVFVPIRMLAVSYDQWEAKQRVRSRTAGTEAVEWLKEHFRFKADRKHDVVSEEPSVQSRLPIRGRPNGLWLPRLEGARVLFDDKMGRAGGGGERRWDAGLAEEQADLPGVGSGARVPTRSTVVHRLAEEQAEPTNGVEEPPDPTDEAL